MEGRLLLVLALTIIHSPLAFSATDGEGLRLQAGRSTFRVEQPTGWQQSPKPSRQNCSTLSIDCLANYNIVFMLTPSDAKPDSPDVRIFAGVQRGALQETLGKYIEQRKACVWPYSTGLTNLRCISPAETPMGGGVQSVEYPAIQTRDAQISLLEFRSRKDSVPLWARAYIQQERDLVEFTFTATDEQAYNRGMPAFRQMLASFRSAENETAPAP